MFTFSHNPIAVRIEDPVSAGLRRCDIFGGSVFPGLDAEGGLTLTLGAQRFCWLHCG